MTFGSPNQLDTTVSADSDGAYVIGLEATDNAGNNGVASFNLNWDTAPPTIKINNPGTAPTQNKTVSASASKGNLSMSITPDTICGNTLQFEAYAPMTFSSESDNGKGICYKAVDDAGNSAYLMSARIIGIDTTKPVISLVGNPTMTVEAKSGYSDLGATASDNVDGDLTSKITVNDSVNANVVGSYTVTYDVSDAAGNKADTATRTVNVVDTTKPVITLIGNSTMTIEIRNAYTDPGATAYDRYDGNITSRIVPDNQVNTNAAGTYNITYDVSDAAGNKAVEVTRTVKVNDTLGLVLLIAGAAIFALVLLAAIAVGAYVFILRKKRRGI